MKDLNSLSFEENIWTWGFAVKKSESNVIKIPIDLLKTDVKNVTENVPDSTFTVLDKVSFTNGVAKTKNTGFLLLSENFRLHFWNFQVKIYNWTRLHKILELLTKLSFFARYIVIHFIDINYMWELHFRFYFIDLILKSRLISRIYYKWLQY